MKESRYNLFVEEGGKHYAFNAMSCALAEIDESFTDALERVRREENIGDKDLEEKMAYGGFIVSSTTDEQELLRMRSWQTKFASRGFGLTIAPTLACNFACPYCYEKARSGIMTDEVADALANMVSDHARHQEPIQVSWYGGEPLLALNFIERLSARFIEICTEYGVPYHAYMVTNGSLITPESIDALLRCHVRGMQITIDGPKDIHDSRRIRKADGKGSFDTIVGNVKLLVDAGVVPDIRINVDKTNQSRVEELISYLAERQLTCCPISFGHVNAYTEACASIEGTCFDVSEYAQRTIAYQQALKRHGFPCSAYPLYPGIKGNYCCADSINSFVVDPDGNLYKCWNDIGVIERSVGNALLLDKASAAQQMQLCEYLLWSPFDFEKCVSCALLPICMGGCPYNGLKAGHEPECEKWKYNLLETLRFAIRNKELFSAQDESTSPREGR